MKTINIVIENQAMRHQPNQAEIAQLDVAQKAGLRPNVATFASILKAYIRTDEKWASDRAQEVVSQWRSSWDIIAYRGLIGEITAYSL